MTRIELMDVKLSDLSSFQAQDEARYLFDFEETSFGADIFLTQFISAVNNGSSTSTSNSIVVRFSHTSNGSDASLH